MSVAHDALQTGIGFAHDALKSVFFSSDTSVLLLKPSTDTNRNFEVVHHITDKWFFEYSAFRQNFLLEIAMGDELTGPVNEATHIQIDDDVFVISQADTLRPKGTDVTWKLFCTRFSKGGQYQNIFQ